MDKDYMLTSILKDEDNKHMIITLLENILDITIKDIQYIGMEKLDEIMEYDFLLDKIKIILENNKHKIIHIRTIKKGKIKESIFCYWSLLHEKYLEDKGEIEIPEKVVIAEKIIEKDKKNIILKTNKNIGYSAEVALVDLKEFINKKFQKDEEFKKLLNKNEDNILFLGMIGIDF